MKPSDERANSVMKWLTDHGKVTNVSAGSGTAPSALGACVVNAINGLTLDPPDARTGDATFDYAFSVKS